MPSWRVDASTVNGRRQDMDEKMQAALERFAQAMVEAHEALGQLTCSEFQPIPELLVLLGKRDEAGSVIIGHALGDDDADDVHGESFEALNQYPNSAASQATVDVLVAAF